MSDEVYQLRAEIEIMRNELHSLDEKVDTIISTIGQQSSIIRTFEDERMREVGAKGMVKYLVGLLGAGLMSIAYNLHDIIWFFWPPKH
jgi:hypothetical protein